VLTIRIPPLRPNASLTRESTVDGADGQTFTDAAIAILNPAMDMVVACQLNPAPLSGPAVPGAG